MRIAVIGKGMVGRALAPSLARAGHEVVYGVRDPSDPKYSGGDELPLKPTAEAVEWAEVVVAAIHWPAVDALLSEIGDLSGKILIDCTNPYAFTEGMRPLVDSDSSPGQEISKRVNARVVKTLNHISAEVMASANTYTVPPLQFVAGDDAAAKQTVMALLRDIGFEPRDTGGIELSRDLEALARLYVVQAFNGMDRSASWALVGSQGKSIG
jgi:predicted dinucleotide-binding enzyme